MKNQNHTSPPPSGELEGATKWQKQLIHINAPTRDLKEELVQWATNDNAKISCNDLTFDQANEVMIKLGLNPHRKPSSSPRGRLGGDGASWSTFNIKNTQHKYILSLLRQIGWTRGSDRYGSVADMQRFGQWLQSEKSPVRKPLNKQTKAETTKIINAMESILGKKFSGK